MTPQKLPEILNEGNANVRQYLKDQLDFLKLDTLEKVAKVSSMLISSLALIMVAGSFLLIANLALAIIIGEKMGSLGMGFAIVAGIYLLLLIVLIILRKPLIINPVQNKVIQEFLTEDGENLPQSKTEHEAKENQ